ncbi:MAG: GPW/gp25 family protein, partial [Verrucomicrobia bacterium]|nr:GPW/gp25 family protein [Verrucomicrobiota bacterium]
MTNATAPLDRIQPCLLDRVTDEAPDRKEESRTQRVISLQRYRAGVLRDLDWLFNAIGHYPNEQVGAHEFEDFPEAYRSVINFGLRQYYGWLAPDVEEIEKQVYDAVTLFEPRINRHTLQVRVS